jgi:hypothetical protein
VAPSLPRYFAARPVRFPSRTFTGWSVVDSRGREGRLFGRRLVEGLDEETARILVRGLNEGVITEEDVLAV